MVVDPAPPGRVIPGSHIPNIRPQVDLNFVHVNLQHFDEIHLPLLVKALEPAMMSPSENLETCHDVIFNGSLS